MNCIKCGKEIPDGARFCNFCGVKQELTCASCGTVLPAGSAFCHVCGSPVQGETNPEHSFDPYADPDDPYAALYEEGSAQKAEVSEQVEDPDGWGTLENLKGAEEWFSLNKPEEVLEETGEVENSGEWDDFGDWDDEESEEQEETAEEGPFDDALFDELDEESIEEEKPELILPNEQNFAELFQIIGRTSCAHREYNRNTKKNDGPWKLEVQLWWGDAHHDIYYENTDPDYRCYGCFTIIKKDPRHHYQYNNKNGSGYYIEGGIHPDPAFPGLKDLMAYTLSDSGIYYATRDGKICFLDSEDGSTQVLGNQGKVISLNYDAGVLTVFYVKDIQQTGYNEHRDECGGYTEACYNTYKLDVGELDIQHPDDEFFY